MKPHSVSQKAPWLKVLNYFDTTAPAELLIQGPIGDTWDGSGTREKEFSDALKDIPEDKEIIVGINSEGGSIKDGLGIYHALLRRGDKVTTRVDGYAVSIASVIALAGSRRISPDSSIWMIHEPWSMAVGNSEDMRKEAVALDAHANAIAAVYASRTKLSAEDARAKMTAETWFRGKEAVDLGFATEVTTSSAALNKLDATRFKNCPPEILKIFTAAPNGANPKPTTPLSPPVADSTSVAAKPVTDAAVLLSSGNDADGIAGNAAGTTNQPTKTIMPETTQPAAAIPPAHDKTTSPDMAALKDAILELTHKVDVLTNPPVAAARSIEVVGNPGINAIEAKAAGRARMDFLRDNWNSLAAGGVPLTPKYNANTIDTTNLTTAMLSSGLIVVLQNRLAPLASFTRDFTIDPIKPLAVVQVPIATTGGTAQSNATDFEDTTNFVGTLDNVAITPARLTAGSYISAANLQGGFRMAQWAEIKAHELADKIQAAVNAIITTTNFDRKSELTSGATSVVSTAAAFAKTDLDDMWASIAKSPMKYVMLDGNYFKRFLPANLESFNPLQGNSLPGWDGFYLNTYWTGAETNTKGFACNPQAIAVAAGLPAASPNRGQNTSVQVVTLPGLALSVELQQWYSTSTKTDWANWEVMFGAAKGDPAAGCLLKSQ